MRGALGPEVALRQPLNTLQHTRTLLQGTQKHRSRTHALLQGSCQIPGNVAEWKDILVRVLYAFLVVAVEVLCGFRAVVAVFG